MRPDADLLTMDIDQWLEDAPAGMGDAAWPSPEEQPAEAHMELHHVSPALKLSADTLSHSEHSQHVMLRGFWLSNL